MQATHFIEVWKGNSDVCKNTEVIDIRNLDNTTLWSMLFDLKTVAIFKIKLK